MKISPKLRIGITIGLLIILFLALNLTNLSKEIKNFFYLISSPIQKTFWRAGDKVSDFFETIKEIKNLKKENEELKLKIQELLAENIALVKLKKENEILRQAIHIGLEKEFRLVLVQIIGKDISQDFILIDKGLEDNLLQGLPVITEQKILVGKIEEVYRNFSKVKLTSHPENSFDVKILNRDFTSEDFTKNENYGIVKGKGNLKLFLDLVPSEKEIKEGDLVVTAALGGIFPPGLLVAETKEVKKSDIKPFQQAEIIPAFNLRELETLFVILTRLSN